MRNRNPLIRDMHFGRTIRSTCGAIGRPAGTSPRRCIAPPPRIVRNHWAFPLLEFKTASAPHEARGETVELLGPSPPFAHTAAAGDKPHPLGFLLRLYHVGDVGDV